LSKILVVDDMALCREPIAEALRRHGHEALCAASGQEALSMARDHRPDLVLLDMNMPVMDGLATLSELRNQPNFRATPVLLLTDRSDREGIIEAGKRGVQGYLLKSSFSLDDLFARIEKCLSDLASAAAIQPASSAKNAISTTKPVSVGAPIRHSSGAGGTERGPKPALPLANKPSMDLTGEKLLAQICKNLELKPLGATVQNVVAATSSTACSAQDVARAAAPDQALCIRLLRVANSSAYRRGQPVSDVKSAIQRVGIQEVRNLVMTLDVFENYASSVGARIDPRMFWEHSIGCGLIAGGIAKARHAKSAESYFLSGVLHDLGRLILLDQLSNRYAAVCDVAQQHALPLEKAEAQSLRLDHCEVLGKALEHWKFPRDFIVPVTSHHLTMEKLMRLQDYNREAAATIILANRIAHAMLLGDSGDDAIHPFDELVDLLQLRPSIISQIVAAVPNETNDLKIAILARSADGAWPSFKEQTKERLARPIHALCVSARPETDAYQLFFENIAPIPVGKTPNLGILYVGTQDEKTELFAKFDEAEKNAGVKDIPLMVIHNAKDVQIDDGWLCARKHRLLGTPTCISTILSVIEEFGCGMD